MNEVGDIVRLALSGALIGAGVVALIVSAAGLLRFPDFYTRLHANAAGDLLGAAAILAGLALAAWDWQTALRLVVLGALWAALAPAAAHMLASAAHGAGLAPLSGAYTAPRPGERAP
ncbi:MAG: monovalent cation/H(+) antiporter subunit G [Hyphomonadaceae bacterium]